MRRVLTALLLLLLALPAAASAQEASPNVQRLASLPELKGAIAVAFDGDVMYASTIAGVFSYDVSDPARPALLGTLPMYIWENEDMDIDRERKRLFVSRDPRGFTTPATPGSAFPLGAVHIIDISDPRLLRQVGFFTLGAGHTSSCVNDCDFLWTAGPGANAQTQPADWKGRPIFATDVRDPANPRPCPAPVATGFDDGVTTYIHDVQVDSDGVAWVSGQGGVKGFWTQGRHKDPRTGEHREATACDPVPFAGSHTSDEDTPSRFMHNSLRQPADDKKVLYATEEALGSNCASTGRFATYDLSGTFKGEGFTVPGHRMRALDTWTPEGAEGATGCASAHYFDRRGDGVTANSFYGQGVRFLDTSDPADLRQVGWYRPSDANVFATYWRGEDTVFVADFTRGVEVLRFTGGPASRTVRAPATAATVRSPMDPAAGFLCPLAAART